VDESWDNLWTSGAWLVRDRVHSLWTTLGIAGGMGGELRKR